MEMVYLIPRHAAVPAVHFIAYSKTRIRSTCCGVDPVAPPISGIAGDVAVDTRAHSHAAHTILHSHVHYFNQLSLTHFLHTGSCRSRRVFVTFSPATFTKN